MKTSGIRRKLDELGRIVLPIEIRKTMDIKEKDDLEISLQDGKIVLEKCVEGDIFTGDTEDLLEFQGKKVAKSSIVALAKLAGLKVTGN